jgi:hypothetical protein
MEFDNVDCFTLLVCRHCCNGGDLWKSRLTLCGGGWYELISSKDEFDIIGEGEIDDNKEEVEKLNPLPSILLEPILKRSRLSRLEGVDLEVRGPS